MRNRHVGERHPHHHENQHGGETDTFSQRPDFGSFDWVMLKNIELKALMGTFYQYIHVAFQGSFASVPKARV
jgi:ammonia channel protein AmtB